MQVVRYLVNILFDYILLRILVLDQLCKNAITLGKRGCIKQIIAHLEVLYDTTDEVISFYLLIMALWGSNFLKPITQ